MIHQVTDPTRIFHAMGPQWLIYKRYYTIYKRYYTIYKRYYTYEYFTPYRYIRISEISVVNRILRISRAYINISS